MAVIYPETVPDPVSGYVFATPLWLAFGSAGYLDFQINNNLPPPFLIAPGHDHWLEELRMMATWTRSKDELGLPLNITYFNDGYYYFPKNGKFEKTVHPRSVSLE